MKDFFWQSMLGLVLLTVVSVLALNMSGLTREAGSFLGKAVNLSGAQRLFRGEKKTGNTGKKGLAVVVLDAGHGGT